MPENLKKAWPFYLLFLLIIAMGFLVAIDKEKGKQEYSAKEEVHFEKKIIGQSVEKRNIEVYTYGNGGRHILFVGGIHGGYEWNSSLLSYRFMDHLKENPDFVPQNLTISVIPTLNPDALFSVVKKEGKFQISDIPKDADLSYARFNARDVDLNRNFACKWQATSVWRDEEVSAGTEAFSEPEARAIRDFVLEKDPLAVVFWHSQSNAVYASECEEGVLSETTDIMNAYSNASDYKAIEVFDAYPITGDAEGWIASIGIPAITVELETHETIEWERNLKGIKAIFEYYIKQKK